jgi:hypothetical protein
LRQHIRHSIRPEKVTPQSRPEIHRRRFRLTDNLNRRPAVFTVITQPGQERAIGILPKQLPLEQQYGPLQTPKIIQNQRSSTHS